MKSCKSAHIKSLLGMPDQAHKDYWLAEQQRLIGLPGILLALFLLYIYNIGGIHKPQLYLHPKESVCIGSCACGDVLRPLLSLFSGRPLKLYFNLNSRANQGV